MNTNLYSPPKAKVAGALPGALIRPQSVLLLISTWVLVVLLMAIAIIVPLITSSFAQLLSAFGADLPPLTLFVISTANYWGIFAVLALVLAIDATLRENHSKKYRWRSGSLTVALFVVVFIALVVGFGGLYLPIFKMGQTL